MSRPAYLSASTIGSIEAYDAIITDISDVLEDENVDIKKLFYGGMILSGIDKLKTKSEILQNLPDSIREYATPLKGDVHIIDAEVEEFLWSHARIRRDDKQSYLIEQISMYMTDILIAAKYGLPLLTAHALPDKHEYSKYLKRDVLDVVAFMEKSITSIETNSPFIHSNIDQHSINRVQKVIGSKIFRNYSTDCDFVRIENYSTSALRKLENGALEVARKFEDVVSIRRVVTNLFGLVPDVVEVFFGKILGKVSKVVTDPIENIIQNKSLVQIHSFHPVWREIWEGKLDKVRVNLAAERSKRSVRLAHEKHQP